MLFSWPSATRPQACLADRQSALFSRDALEITIAALARSDATCFNFVAHSIGALLLVDTLRLLARVDHDRVFDKRGAVVLISPDIEIDVFRQQAEPLLARGVPIDVLVSRRHRALRSSALMRGERSRLGSIRSQPDLGALDVSVIDLSIVRNGDRMDQFKVGTSPELIEFIRSRDATGLGVFEAGKGPGVVGCSATILQAGADLILEPLAGRRRRATGSASAGAEGEPGRRPTLAVAGGRARSLCPRPWAPVDALTAQPEITMRKPHRFRYARQDAARRDRRVRDRRAMADKAPGSEERRTVAGGCLRPGLSPTRHEEVEVAKKEGLLRAVVNVLLITGPLASSATPHARYGLRAKPPRTTRYRGATRRTGPEPLPQRGRRDRVEGKDGHPRRTVARP